MFLTTTVNSQKKKQSQEYNYLIIITGKNWNIQQPYHYNTTFNMYKHKNKLYFYHGKKKHPTVLSYSQGYRCINFLRSSSEERNHLYVINTQFERNASDIVGWGFPPGKRQNQISLNVNMMYKRPSKEKGVGGMYVPSLNIKICQNRPARPFPT